MIVNSRLACLLASQAICWNVTKQTVSQSSRLIPVKCSKEICFLSRYSLVHAPSCQLNGTGQEWQVFVLHKLL